MLELLAPPAVTLSCASAHTVCLLRGTDWVFMHIILRSAHTVCLCVLCASQNKQRLFPNTALTDWLVFIRTE
jgi:hypothetical protein